MPNTLATVVPLGSCISSFLIRIFTAPFDSKLDIIELTNNCPFSKSLFLEFEIGASDFFDLLIIWLMHLWL